MRWEQTAVTGIGLVTPAGIGTAATWERVCDGPPTAAPDPELHGHRVDFSCRVTDLDAQRRLGGMLTLRLDRAAQMAILAAREAVADAQLDPETWDDQRVAVVLGVGSNSLANYAAGYAHLNAGRPEKISAFALPRSVPNMVAGEVSLDLGARGPSLTTSTACSSGTTALGLARDLLRSGSCDIAITGGSENPITTMGTTCFTQMGALSQRCHDPARASRPFDAERDGFVLGEGAGILVLERTEHAGGRGIRPQALLSGFGASCDAHHYTVPAPSGEGLGRAGRTALDDAGLAPDDIGHVNAHGTGTKLNDTSEAAALRGLFGRHPPPVTANKSVLGHGLGAAGGIEAAVTVLTLRQGLIPPTANLERQDPDIDLDVVAKAPRPTEACAALSVSAGFGGQNAAVVLTTP